MIQVTDKSRCCGCNACGDVCPKDAISFHIDIEGFWYPVVDKERCINCGLCDNVCPVIHVEELKKNDLPQSECHAAIHKNSLYQLREHLMIAPMHDYLLRSIQKVLSFQ